MALTATVSKAAVTKGGMAKLWHPSVTLTVTDSEGPGFTEVFSTSYKKDGDFAALRAPLATRMQKAIDDYKQEQTYLKSTVFTNLVTALNSDLEEV